MVKSPFLGIETIFACCQIFGIQVFSHMDLIIRKNTFPMGVSLIFIGGSPPLMGGNNTFHISVGIPSSPGALLLGIHLTMESNSSHVIGSFIPSRRGHSSCSSPPPSDLQYS